MLVFFFCLPCYSHILERSCLSFLLFPHLCLCLYPVVSSISFSILCVPVVARSFPPISFLHLFSAPLGVFLLLFKKGFFPISFVLFHVFFHYYFWRIVCVFIVFICDSFAWTRTGKNSSTCGLVPLFLFGPPSHIGKCCLSDQHTFRWHNHLAADSLHAKSISQKTHNQTRTEKGQK